MKSQQTFRIQTLVFFPHTFFRILYRSIHLFIISINPSYKVKLINLLSMLKAQYTLKTQQNTAIYYYIAIVILVFLELYKFEFIDLQLLVSCHIWVLCLVYTLLMGFIYFLKFYRFSHFTTFLKRFWSLLFIYFWGIEFSTIMTFIYLLTKTVKEDTGFSLNTNLLSDNDQTPAGNLLIILAVKSIILLYICQIIFKPQDVLHTTRVSRENIILTLIGLSLVLYLALEEMLAFYNMTNILNYKTRKIDLLYDFDVVMDKIFSYRRSDFTNATKKGLSSAIRIGDTPINDFSESKLLQNPFRQSLTDMRWELELLDENTKLPVWVNLLCISALFKLIHLIYGLVVWILYIHKSLVDTTTSDKDLLLATIENWKIIILFNLFLIFGYILEQANAIFWTEDWFTTYSFFTSLANIITNILYV